MPPLMLTLVLVTPAFARETRLEGLRGESCELQIDMMPGTANRCGVIVRASPDGRERTLLYYDADAKELVFDSTQSGVDGRKALERAPLALKQGETLKLRVFVDKSVVEVFANDRQAICRRVYPVRKDSLGISLFARGGDAEALRIATWGLSPSNPY